jgi:hypothetical protein
LAPIAVAGKIFSRMTKSGVLIYVIPLKGTSEKRHKIRLNINQFRDFIMAWGLTTVYNACSHAEKSNASHD